MVKRIRKTLGVLAAALLAVCALALPAWAWSDNYDGSYSSYTGGYELMIDEDYLSLFTGTELQSTSLNDQSELREEAWLASGLSGVRRTYALADVYLARVSSGARVDLSAPENKSLANAPVWLLASMGSSVDTDLDNVALMRYSQVTEEFRRLEYYTVEYHSGTVNGEPATLYYFVVYGTLSDVMSVYAKLTAIPNDAPEQRIVDYDNNVYHTFYYIDPVTDAHSHFDIIQEKDAETYSPVWRTNVDGSPNYRFDSTLGFKFTAYADDGYKIDSVTYTVNGVTKALKPVSSGLSRLKGDSGTADYPTYQVPPCEGVVTVTITSRHIVGWASENGTWYYYNTDGSLLKNGFVKYAGTYYYFGTNGKLMKEGWAIYLGKYYYIKNYKPVVNAWVSYGGKYFYLNKSGNPVVNNWIKYADRYYHFNGYGVCDYVY